MSKLFDALARAGGEPAQITRQMVEEQLEAAMSVAPPGPPPGPAASDGLPPPPPEEPRPSPEASIRIAPVKPALAPVLPFDKDHNRASEQYRIIRTKIVQHPAKPRLLVISSASPRDGKTISAINLAGALSMREGVNVLLVDGDLRRPSIGRLLGLPDTHGLNEVLSGKTSLADALIRIEQFPNLYVLCSGESCANPVELLDSPTWSQLCALFRRQFRFTIVDAPPVGAVADYDLIQEACDSVILIVRPDHTPRTLCYNTLRAIPEDKLLGVLLNSVSDWFLGRGSSYYYYSGYYQYASRE